MQLRKFFELRPLGEFSGGDGASRQNVDKAGQNVLEAIYKPKCVGSRFLRLTLVKL